jgi:hypothetical protein
MALNYKLLSLVVLLTSCGYHPPKDQCIGNGTECEHEEPVVIRGERGEAGPPGPQGDRGPQGPVGPAGEKGTSCTAARTTNGAVISCADGTSVLILDGEDGTDAPPTAYTITEMIDPCGKQASFDEVLLRLANRSLVAHFSSGSKEFLTVIGPGSYITTDGTNCRFTVDSNLEVRW